MLIGAASIGPGLSQLSHDSKVSFPTRSEKVRVSCETGQSLTGKLLPTIRQQELEPASFVGALVEHMTLLMAWRA
jgi:hypothetical protein